jgi:hypothetical protein
MQQRLRHANRRPPMTTMITAVARPTSRTLGSRECWQTAIGSTLFAIDTAPLLQTPGLPLSIFPTRFPSVLEQIVWSILGWVCAPPEFPLPPTAACPWATHVDETAPPRWAPASLFQRPRPPVRPRPVRERRRGGGGKMLQSVQRRLAIWIPTRTRGSARCWSCCGCVRTTP